MVSLFYASILFIATLTCLFAVGILWRWRNTPSAIALMCLMVSLGIWSVAYAFHWLATDLDTRFFWLASTYVGVISAPVFIFFFALVYTDKEKWITKQFIALMTTFPVLTLVIMWTDRHHGLFFGGVRVDANRIFDGGIWFWLNAIYGYSLILVSYVIIMHAWYRAIGIYRQQSALVLAALTAPIVVNVGGLIGFFPLSDVDTTPLLFTLTGAVIIYALFYKKLLDLVPIARDRVMQTMGEPFFVIDKQDRLVDLNDAAVRLCKTLLPRIDLKFIGLPITRLFPAWRQWLSAKETVGEFAPDSASPEAVQTYEWRISSITDAQENLRGRVLLLNNITRRKLATQREFELALEKERVKLLQQFIQNTAHEIRTPLSIISSAMYLIVRHNSLDRRMEKVEQVEKQIERITRLVNMSLIMSELENSAIKINTVIDVVQLLNIMIEEVTGRYKNVVVPTLESCQPPPRVMGDVDYLGEAFKQLLDNACRFSPDMGVVAVRVDTNAGQVRVEIRDEGRGIPEDQMPFIFNTFWRQDVAHSTQGFGIGLSIASMAIEQHHGEIHVTSEVGKGTTISVVLPALEQRESGN